MRGEHRLPGQQQQEQVGPGQPSPGYSPGLCREHRLLGQQQQEQVGPGQPSPGFSPGLYREHKTPRPAGARTSGT